MTEVAGVCGVVTWTKVKPDTLEVIKICIEVQYETENHYYSIHTVCYGIGLVL